MVQVAVGSTNPVKVNAVIACFGEDAEGISVASGVRDQPWGDEETIVGAKQRAKAAMKQAQAKIGIGLEGGVQLIDERLYVCNWGALVDEDGVKIVAGGARFPLPEEIKEKMVQGEELGPVISAFAKRSEVNKKEGAIGIFTNSAITRTDMYKQIVELLLGQYHFYTR
ncbi:DUF84 family protein [Pseudalkalibacillus hwajinpoensis]|uniref:inosine/xanthosine triphosphatase n=1 Tax=Guptibacillus hwajinpoensis TaxID=208199 RepID=A0A4U1MCI0_9BACL|nr:DUF84 family protein [Pseudalkalibacillus hwajinpoensis]TKD67974.1 DUF84 family protein [Pseudalkalibacillus hwajinpoensis]